MRINECIAAVVATWNTTRLTSSLSRAICAATHGTIEKTVAILTGLLVAGLCPGLELGRRSGDGSSTTLTEESLLSLLTPGVHSSSLEGSTVSGDL